MRREKSLDELIAHYESVIETYSELLKEAINKKNGTIEEKRRIEAQWEASDIVRREG